MKTSPKVTCIIAEYNPFHNGHAHHIERTLRETMPDMLVVIMSGDFTERGDCAVCRKEIRARWAVCAGADVVFELPPVFAVSSAENFAYGAMKTLSRNFPGFTLSFGSECGDITVLKRVSDILNNENSGLSLLIKQNLKDGKSYPRARGEAFSSLYPDLAPILLKPNNILALEYLKAAEKIGGVKLHTVAREDNFNSDKIDGSFASAAAVRELLKTGEDITSYVPQYVAESLWAAYSKDDISAAEYKIFERMRDISKADLTLTAGVKEGLENRFKKFIPQAENLNELLTSVKTKRYTMASLKRICVSAYLGITAADTEAAKENPPAPLILAKR
ncbi:MAG: nucleotidyltransferase family protein [Clostridiaceae bacterium]|jgi:predicted nucleotidyltransferase|nr:nucleotidyltransferase family protein [Clostridiaceae bacterium]